MEVGETLEVASAKPWRAWLRANHRRKREVWLVFHSKASGHPSIAYDAAVEEALCWGWIDSVVKPLDKAKGTRAQRFTPRRKGSNLSATNAARARRLVREGRMTRAGLAALAEHRDALRPGRVVVAPDVRRAFERAGAWRAFQRMSPDYRRIRLGWVEGARSRPEVFRKRLDHLVRMTRQGKQFGMVRG